jgi:hypothetical protein
MPTSIARSLDWDDEFYADEFYPDSGRTVRF